MFFRGSLWRGAQRFPERPALALGLADGCCISSRARPLGVAAVGGHKGQQKAACQKGGQHYSTRCLEVPSHLYRRLRMFEANEYNICPSPVARPPPCPAGILQTIKSAHGIRLDAHGLTWVLVTPDYPAGVAACSLLV